MLTQALDAVVRLNYLLQFIYASMLIRLPWFDGDQRLTLEKHRMASWMLWADPLVAPADLRQRARLVVLLQIALAVAFSLAFSGCGGASADPQPTIPARITQITPYPTYPPYPTFTPYPTMDATAPATASEPATPLPAPTLTLTPPVTPHVLPTMDISTPTTPAPATTSALTPSVTPAPTSTPPRYRPANEADISGRFVTEGLTLDKLTINNDFLIIQARTDRDLKPTQIQVWQSNRPLAELGRCPSDRPIAFIGPDKTGQSSYSWPVCVLPFNKLAQQTEFIPWVPAEKWAYTERPRPNTVLGSYLPRVWDWSVRVDLDIPEVWEKEYRLPVGYTVIIFSNDKLLAKVWVDF